MREKQITAIARFLGRLKGQDGIDEKTRRACVDAVESAIQHTSTKLDGHTLLMQFRELANVARTTRDKE